MDSTSIITQIAAILSLIQICLSQLPGGAMDQNDMFSAMNYWVQINSVMGLISIHNAKSWQQLYDLYHGNNYREATFMLGRRCNIITEPCSAVNSICLNGFCDCLQPNQNFLDIFCLHPNVIRVMETKTGLGPINVTKQSLSALPATFAPLNITDMMASTSINNFSALPWHQDFSGLLPTTPTVPQMGITFPSLLSNRSLETFQVTQPTSTIVQNLFNKNDFISTANRFTEAPKDFSYMSTIPPKVDTISIEDIEPQAATEPPKIIKRIRGPRRKGVRKPVNQFPAEEQQNDPPFYY